MVPLLAKKISPAIARKLEPSRNRLNERLVTLASGAIVLTFTSLQIIGAEQTNFRGWLKASWVFFGGAILSGVLLDVLKIRSEAHLERGFYLITRKDEQGKRAATLDEANEARSNVDWSLGYLRWSFRLELIELICFMLGLILLLAFMFKNF